MAAEMSTKFKGISKENLMWTTDDLVTKIQDLSMQFDEDAQADKQILDGVLLLLMVANDNELDAAKCYFSKSKAQVLESQNNIYYVGKWGQIPAALVKQSEQGTSGPDGSQDLTRISISVFKNLKVIIALGICGTMGRLGDVIVSSRIDEYKFKVLGKRLIPRGNNYPPGSKINKYLQHNSRAWSFKCTKPGVEEYKSKAVFQPMLSGTPLIASGEYRDHLIQNVSEEAGGVEMEGIGIINGIRIAEKTSQIEFIIVKSGCDYADESKNKEWQPVAAMAAADFVYNQLNKTIVIDWFKSSTSSVGSTQPPGGEPVKAIGQKSSVGSTQPPPGREPIEGYCSGKSDYLTTHWPELCNLPYDGMKAQLKANKVITEYEKDIIDAIAAKSEKMDKLLTIVQTSLNVDQTSKYRGFLKSMEESENDTLKKHAKKLGGSESVPDI